MLRQWKLSEVQLVSVEQKECGPKRTHFQLLFKLHRSRHFEMILNLRHKLWTLRADFLNAVFFRQGLTCTLGLTNDLIDGGQPRAKNGF